MCDEIGIIKEGNIVAEGSLNQLRQLVKAEEIISIQTEEKEKAIARGKELGFTHRYYGNELGFWLPTINHQLSTINHQQYKNCKTAYDPKK